jgi:hypothetical protein
MRKLGYLGCLMAGLLAVGGCGTTIEEQLTVFPKAGASDIQQTAFESMASEWALTDSMALPRMRHTATLLESGKVLVAGGYITAPRSFTTPARAHGLRLVAPSSPTEATLPPSCRTAGCCSPEAV